MTRDQAYRAGARAHLDMFGDEAGRKWIKVLEELQKFAHLTSAPAGENTITWFMARSADVWDRQREIGSGANDDPH